MWTWMRQAPAAAAADGTRFKSRWCRPESDTFAVPQNKGFVCRENHSLHCFLSRSLSRSIHCILATGHPPPPPPPSLTPIPSPPLPPHPSYLQSRQRWQEHRGPHCLLSLSHIILSFCFTPNRWSRHVMSFTNHWSLELADTGYRVLRAAIKTTGNEV